MRRDLMDILACPVCKGELLLTVQNESGQEITDGLLDCATCDETYPIIEGIPNLLPPEMRHAIESADADQSGSEI